MEIPARNQAMERMKIDGVGNNWKSSCITEKISTDSWNSFCVQFCRFVCIWDACTYVCVYACVCCRLDMYVYVLCVFSVCT